MTFPSLNAALSTVFNVSDSTSRHPTDAISHCTVFRYNPTLLIYFPLKWLWAFCQMEFSTKASLRSISISWSPQSWVGKDCRNMIIPCESRKPRSKGCTSYYRPGNPFVVAFRSTLQEMQNTRINEIGKMHPGLPPTLANK